MQQLGASSITYDKNQLTGSIALGVLVVVIAIVVVWWRQRRLKDQIFVGVTPGLIPGVGQPRNVGRTRGKEYDGPIAVQFHPPAEVSPGLVGTVIDGSADRHDVSAMLMDLAVRGFLRIHAVLGPDGKPTNDWELERNPTLPPGPLTPLERELLSSIFVRPRVQLSAIKGQFGMSMRQAQTGLYREVIERGFYRNHPKGNRSWLKWFTVLVMVPASVALTALSTYGFWTARLSARDHDVSLMPLAAGFIIASIILFIWCGSRSPRTPEGTAVRIQALGFREYIERAEAPQIRFEEARQIFSRYLPYAMAFGLASVWAKTFAQVAANAQAAGYGDIFAGGLDFLDLGSVAWDLGSFGFDAVGSALSGADGFDAGVGGLFDGDGCGLDGCPADGCNPGDVDACDSCDVLGGCDGCSW